MENCCWGIGTWVESKFDLSSFRGRRIRVRFLADTPKVNNLATDWEDNLGWNPTPSDDGWWIDDVMIEGALVTPASVSLDNSDNSSLPNSLPDTDTDGIADVCDNCAGLSNMAQLDGDYDGQGDLCDVCPFDATDFDPDSDLVCGDADNCPFDANPTQTDADFDDFGFPCDCDDTNDTVFPGAVEVNDGLDNSCNGSVDDISGTAVMDASGVFSWPAQEDANRYEVARAESSDFTVACTILTPSGTSVQDTTVPSPGVLLHYLVRATSPNLGGWGTTSAGVERDIPCD